MKRSCLAVLGLVLCGAPVFGQSAPAAAAPAATAPAPSAEEKAAELKTKAEAGDADAMVRYGLMQVDGIAGKADTAAAVAWFKKAAEKGNPAGMYCYGRAVMSGMAGKPDQKAGLDWIIKAAKAGDAKACSMLFDNLRGSVSTPAQANGALELGEAAVKAGSVDSMVNMAMILIYGEINGVPVKQDMKRGIELLEKATELGSPVAPAFLGHVYSANFRDVPVDYAKAFSYAQKAADRGNPMGIYDMAVAYGLGRGVEKDTAKAVELTKKAAGMGHLPSMRQLERIYRQGVDVEKNTEEADKWKKKVELAEKAQAAQRGKAGKPPGK